MPDTSKFSMNNSIPTQREGWKTELMQTYYLKENVKTPPHIYKTLKIF